MLLLIEIGLTIWAWARGWRWYALLPLGLCLLLGFIIGFTMGSVVLTDEFFLVATLIDLAAIGILIYMGIEGKNKEKKL